jgi:hypothetical protein
MSTPQNDTIFIIQDSALRRGLKFGVVILFRTMNDRSEVVLCYGLSLW